MVLISLLLYFFMEGTETRTYRLNAGPLELLVLFWVLVLSGPTLGQEQGPGGVKVVVREDSDVVLPCSLSTKESFVWGLFDWRKDAQKDGGQVEVFLYDAGIHYNNGRPGQSEQFKGRVSHFPNELKHGNASIIIRNTKTSDSGVYSCYFPRLQPPQISYINLVVERVLKDRSGENPAAAPKASVTTLDATSAWALLQCDVHGASLTSEVEWRDETGTKLPAEETRTPERDHYHITLNTTVTQTGHYRCVATQEEISHQTQAEIFVHISGKVSQHSSSEAAGWIGGFSFGVLTVVAVLVLLVVTKIITIRCNKGPREEERGPGQPSGPSLSPDELQRTLYTKRPRAPPTSPVVEATTASEQEEGLEKEDEHSFIFKEL